MAANRPENRTGNDSLSISIYLGYETFRILLPAEDGR